MSDNSQLVQLCKLQHLELSYWDIWGKQHFLSAAAQKKILRTMGLNLDDEEKISQALWQSEQRSWRRLLPPVQVVKKTVEKINIELTIPAKYAQQNFSWCLTTEQDKQLRGEFIPQEQPLTLTKIIDEEEYHRFSFALPYRPELGYHYLQLSAKNGAPHLKHEMSLIVVPEKCYLPPALAQDGRLWGFSLLPYELNSRRNWGIGDFTDLKVLVEKCSLLGADFIGLTPLHALYPSNPRSFSPYSPSSRLFLNILHLDVESMINFSSCALAQQLIKAPDFAARLATLREQTQVDYPAVSALKLPVLEALHQHFSEHDLPKSTSAALAFQNFVQQGQKALHRHVLGEALQEHFNRQRGSFMPWWEWPAPYRDPNSPQVQTFAEQHAQRLEFFQFIQWQADEQLHAVSRAAQTNQLAIGLYGDLAIGVDRAAIEVWANQDLYALGASVGAPPDELALHGQNWGLPPMNPTMMYETGYAHFIATLRRNMRHFGALRLDHVMGLLRLFWIPDGEPATEAAYVYYPLEDLLGILALESMRNQCLIIGEDLGTVPDEVRAALKNAGVLSYRLFYFERTQGEEFKWPQEFESQALVALSTHDLPTICGYWEGCDLRLRDELGLFPSEQMRKQQYENRKNDRWRLLRVLEREKLLPEGMTVNPDQYPQLSPKLVDGLLIHLARSPAKVLSVQLGDLLGTTDQANLPGTTDQHPNWRRKLTVPVEQLNTNSLISSAAQILSQTRPRHNPK